MKKQDKRRLLAVLLAATAVIALVGSATASAAVWKDAGSTVSTSFELGISGAENYEVESSAGGVQCSERFVLSFNGTSKATTVSKFENKGCTKTFGTYSACTAQTAEAIGLPWSVTINATTLTINSMHMKHTFKTGCAKGEINQTLNVTLTPTEVAKFTEVNLLGTSGTYKQFGTLSVDTPTYGIG